MSAGLLGPELTRVQRSANSGAVGPTLIGDEMMSVLERRHAASSVAAAATAAFGVMLTSQPFGS